MRGNDPVLSLHGCPPQWCRRRWRHSVVAPRSGVELRAMMGRKTVVAQQTVAIMWSSSCSSSMPARVQPASTAARCSCTSSRRACGYRGCCFTSRHRRRRHRRRPLLLSCDSILPSRARCTLCCTMRWCIWTRSLLRCRPAALPSCSSARARPCTLTHLRFSSCYKLHALRVLQTLLTLTSLSLAVVGRRRWRW